MKVTNNKIVKIKLSGNEADTFKGIFDKLNDEAKRIGFSSSKMTDEDSKLISKISEKL